MSYRSGPRQVSVGSSAIRLSHDHSHTGDFIDLDGDFASPKPRDPGLVDLMDRFAKHSAAKQSKRKPEQVNMR